MAVHPLPAHCSEDSASNEAPGLDGCVHGHSPRASQRGASSRGHLIEDVGDVDDDASWISPRDAALLKQINSEPGGAVRSNMYHQRQQQQQNHRQIRKLPRGTRPVRFVGEGAANAVFEFKAPRPGRPGSDFTGLLLRVAKVPSLGHPPTYDYLLQQSFYHTAITPILGDHAVHQELVVLRKSGIIDELNALLLGMNHLRKPKFQGSFIGQSDWGFLVEDMRPPNPDECALVEFKPKWLSQSPSAPANAIRCRQCAKDLRSFIENPAESTPNPDTKPCPLALGNPDAPWQIGSPFRIAPQLASNGASDFFKEALKSTINHPIIGELRAQQNLHDRFGPLNASENDPLFAIAMTLRDCTCFAQISRQRQDPGNEKPVRLALGDLDWKDPHVKIGRWRGMEKELIDGGFYTAEWILCRDNYYHAPTRCLLEWPSSKRASTPSIIHALAQSGSEDETFQGSPTHVYQHRTEIHTLERALTDFKKEPAGTPSKSMYNPFRSDPR